MNCHNCGHSLREGAKFCSKCGTSTVAISVHGAGGVVEQPTAPGNICQSCGHDNSPDARFCGNCRARLGEAPAAESPAPAIAPPPPRPISTPSPARPAAMPGALVGRRAPARKGSRILTTVIVVVVILAAAAGYWLFRPGGMFNPLKENILAKHEPPSRRALTENKAELDVKSTGNSMVQSGSGFYIAVLGNYSNEQDAKNAMEKFRVKGISDLDYLYSSEWKNLRPGWWVVFSGKLPDMDSASQSAEAFKSKGYESYPRFTGERKIQASSATGQTTIAGNCPDYLKSFIGTWTDKEGIYLVEIKHVNQKIRIREVWGSTATGTEFYGRYSGGKITAVGNAIDFYMHIFPEFKILANGELLHSCGEIDPPKLNKTTRSMPDIRYDPPFNDD